MYLSMWILAESLKDYDIDTHIISGEMCIRNASVLFSSDRFQPHTVYVGLSEDFIQSMPGMVICANKNDYFIVRNGTIEEVYQKILEAIDYYLEWDLYVRDRIEEKCTLQEVAELGADIMHTLIGIMNAGFIIQAVAGKEYASGIGEENLKDLQPMVGLPLPHVTAYTDILRNRLNAKTPYIFEEPLLKARFFTQNIMINGWLWGFCFFAIPGETVSEKDRQLFHVLNGQFHRWWERSGMQADRPEQNNVFLGLLDGTSTMSRDQVWDFFNRIGWSEEDEKHLCVIRERYGNSLIYSRLIHQISQTFSDCYVLEHEGAVVLILNTSHLPLEVLTSQLPRILHGSEIHIGISYPFRNLVHLPQYLEQAQIALETAFQKNRRICMCQECAVSYTRNLLRKVQTVNLEDPVCKAIRRYDKEHGTEYFITLQTYIMEERSIQRTAAALRIHKNTLLYRIRRLTEEFPLDLDDREERFRLILNFLIYSDYEP